MTNIWRHKKSGGLYTIIDEESFIESTMQRATIYRSLHDNRSWIRPKDEFHDGRFEVMNSMEFRGGCVQLSHSGAF